MGLFGALWGVTGVLLLLIYGIFRLIPHTLETFIYDLSWYHWLFLTLNVLFVAYVKGYHAFHRGLSPRVVARAKYIYSRPNIRWTLLAPLFCMGYFHISGRKKLVTILMTIAMIFLIFLVRLLVQPWRGIVDAGIIIALGWGVISLLGYSAYAITSTEFNYPAQIPENKQPIKLS